MGEAAWYEFDLPARPPRAGEDAVHFVAANGIWHHVLEYGSGPSVIVVPGMTASAATFAAVAGRLSDRYGVFVVDVRGRGLSDQPAEGFSLHDYAADLAGVIARLRLAAPIVVGHSMGARIAAALDLDAPGLCRGLVLVDPPLSGPGRPPYPNPLDMYEAMFRAARSADPVARLRTLEPTVSDEALAERVRWLRVTDEHAILETHRNFHVEDFHALYAAVTTPAVLIRGGESTVVTEAGAAELRGLRPDIPVVSVAGAGHLVPQENLDGFCEAIVAFADGLNPAAAPLRRTA